MENRLDLAEDDLDVISDAVIELLVKEKKEMGDSLEEMEDGAKNILRYATVLGKINRFLESREDNDEESSTEETAQETE